MPRFILTIFPLLAGCPHFAQPSTSAYTCGGTQPPLPRIHEPARMLAVTPKSAPPASWSALAPPPADPWDTAPANPWSPQPATPPTAPPTDAYGSLAATMILDVVADRAPLGSVAVAIARAAHLDIVVQPSLEDLPITLSLRDTSLAQVQQVLARDYGVHAAMTDGVLYLASFDELIHRQLLPPPPALLNVVIESPDDVPAEQFAAAWCGGGASPRGYAAVLGDAVLFQDTQAGVTHAQALHDQLTPDDD